jgi:uncharacterized protein
VVDLTNPFDDERLHKARSALIRITPDEQGRYVFDLACQYTREGLNQLQVGDLIGVENYCVSPGDHSTYSVLSLTQAMPLHFAAQGDGAYPGHLFESMRSIKKDWEQQKEEPRYATTTIECKAISTGWQFTYNETSTMLPELNEEQTLPMVGAEIRPLNQQMVDAIINYGMDVDAHSPLIHKKFNDIEIKLDKRALLTTHFGIFGFTGVGKSNFVSSLISSLTTSSEGENEANADAEVNQDGQDYQNMPNLIIVDPNDEYLALFIDKIINNPESVRYIHVGLDSLPTAIIQSLDGINTNITADNVALLSRQIHIPHNLKINENVRQYISQGMMNALCRTAIVIAESDLASFIRNDIQRRIVPSSGQDTKDCLMLCQNAWVHPLVDQPITLANIDLALNLEAQFQSPVRAPIQNLNSLGKQSTANGVINGTVAALRRLRTNIEHIPANAVVPVHDLIQELNDTQNPVTMIITGRRDYELKQFCTVLGNELYESRRTGATGDDIEPYTLLLLDEADLFIPSETDDENTKQMKEMCITFARRGRKFNLGIGISTQRASMLDTQIMGNLHTYFVSKLPRKNDRERVAEAFGIGNEELSPTFTFRAGSWLVISHDATGLKGVPIPTIAEDANQRIITAADQWIDPPTGT